MSKRLMAAALVGLALAGASVRADSQDQRVQRQLRSYLGVRVDSSSQDGDENGVAISQVVADSPAARAGLKQGDVITRIGQRPVEDFRDLANAVLRLQSRQRFDILVERDGREQKLSVRLGEPRMPRADEDTRDGQNRYGRTRDDASNDDPTFQRLQSNFRRIEARLQKIERQAQSGQGRGDSDEQLRDLQRLQQRVERLEQRIEDSPRSGQYGRQASGVALGVKTREWRRQSDSRQGGSADEGVMVTAIESNSPASESGLRRGDIITSVDERNVTSTQELRQALQRSSNGQEVTLQVLRGSRQMELNVRLESGSSNTAQGRRYQRLQERLERLENRIRDLEQNQ